uniref:procollagen-proline 4-dioxygenase n=1 Tax=Glossina brevipalpis TaxID=37001 RepID=A0A1A9WN31_9MUSC
MLKAFLFLLFTTITSTQPTGGDIEKSFAISVNSMTPLLDVEKQLIEILENYLEKLERKVDLLKNLAAKMTADNFESLEDPEGYVSNPLNSFRLIRRLQRDWINIESFMIQQEGEEYLEAMEVYHKQMPTATDLEDAANGIYRLQTVYDLEIDAMSDGILNGKQYKYRLSSLDRFTMGVHLFHQKHYYHACFWLYSSLISYRNHSINRILDFKKAKIFELYAEALMQQNRPKDALVAITNAVELESFNIRLLKRKNDIETLAKIHITDALEYKKIEPDFLQLGCRGNISNIPSKLHCIYNTKTTSFLRLAPLKMEFLSDDPYMVLYHDVLTDREILTLKDLGKTNLKRATIFDKSQLKNTINKDRIAKYSWLPHDNTSTTQIIAERIGDMTGLNISGSEPLQIMNYGLGGHFGEHYDFFNLTENTYFTDTYSQGDRIVTVLFYMSDVEQGGNTVFPYMRTVVSPKKGTALVWYNLNNKLIGDWRTQHAACPVLVGSKWVLTKWINSMPQIFTKPCYS